MTELEDRLSSALAARAASVPAPPPLGVRATTAGTRRVLQLAAAAAAVVGIAVAASWLPLHRTVTPPVVGQPRNLSPVLVTTAGGDLALLDLTSRQSRVVSVGAGRRVATIAGTGDGRTFYLGRALRATGCASVLNRVHVEAGIVRETQLLRSEGLINEIAVSPDGRTLAYVATMQQPAGPKNRCDLAEMHMRDLQTGLDTRLVADAAARPGEPLSTTLVGAMSWNANGSRLVFVVQECCDGSVSIRAIEPGRTLAPDYLHTPVIADTTDVGCLPESVVQRERDLLISAAGCGSGSQVFLLSWNEQRHRATRIAVLKSRLSSMTYRSQLVVAEQDSSVITIDRGDKLTGVAAGYEPGW